jgi:hypothetical protein
MKKILLPVILMLLAGCDYETPLSQTASSEANPALAGTWIEPAADGNPVTMEIKISGKDYSVTYTEGSNSLSFKGFEIKAADLNLVQLELLGDTEGSKNKYLFVKYELNQEGLSVYRLNPEVVSAKCQTAEELLNDIATHRQDPSLFTEPLKFTASIQPGRRRVRTKVHPKTTHLFSPGENVSTQRPAGIIRSFQQ